MDIILLIEKFPHLSKSEITEGKIPKIALKISNFLRSTFLLSNTLLHDNNLIIFCSSHFTTNSNGLIIFFQGKKLRYLAPDERGILFLLLKIHKIINGEGGKKQEKKEHLKFRQMHIAQSTPGIYVKRGEFKEIWNLYPLLGKDFIIVGNTSKTSPELHSISELESIIHSKSVIVFNHPTNFVLDPPDKKSIYIFSQESWKAKFYESELISLIQSKIND